MYLYFLIIAVFIFVLIYMHIETRILKVEKFRLSDNNNKIKIAHLSDIHIGSMFVTHNRIKNILLKEDPDIIILSGDYVEKEAQIPKFLRFLDSLSNKPVYACFGNHDYRAFLRNGSGLDNFQNKIEKKGIVMLRNQNTVLSIKGRSINIVGIEDIRYKKHNVKKAFSGIDYSKTTIAFSHNPDIIFSLGSNKPDLLLTGHFHGGQIWTPFRLEFKLMRKEKLSKLKIYKGLNTVNKINLFINRGIGNVVFPLRFLSKPEIAFFEI